MSKIKLIVEIDEDDYKAICSDKGYSYANTMWWIIRNGTPYNPTGDCISREALKEHKVYSEERHEYVVPVYNIDNAQAVDLWQMRQEATENALKKAEVLYGRPKGEWIECRSSDHWKCDKCGHPAPLESRDCEWLSNFCPDCGADMRKGGAE